MKKLILLAATIMISIYGCTSHKQNDSVSRESAIFSDTLTYASPEQVGMSKAKVNEAKTLFEKAVEAQKVIGYQILVARKGNIILHEAGGFRDLDKQLPMHKNTLLNVASNTKSLTAAAILKLADEGKLSIEDKVSKYLPGFETGLSNKITIKQLLLHLAGYMRFDIFHDGLTPYSTDEPEAPSLKVEAKELGLFGPEEEPGSVFRYNNLGYNVLAAIVEELSGVKLNVYFKKNFYQPLGMKETANLLSEVNTSRLSKQYYFINDEWVLWDTFSNYPPIARGNGGTISTALDFAKFFQMLANKGRYNNHKILKEETVKTATSPLIEVSEAYLSEKVELALGLPSSEWYEYRDPRDLNIDKHRGYGFVVSDNGGFSHAGIYGTFAYADIKKELVIIIFTQSIYGGNPGQEFIETIYESIK